MPHARMRGCGVGRGFRRKSIRRGRFGMRRFALLAVVATLVFSVTTVPRIAFAQNGAPVVIDGPLATAPVSARKILVLLVDIVDANNVKHAISANCDGSIDKGAEIAFGYNTTAASVDGCYQDSSYAKMGWGGASYPGTDVDV